MTEPSELDREMWARRFHDLYESLAPGFGYETRAETRQFDPLSRNGQLMQAVCGDIVQQARAESHAAGRKEAFAEARGLVEHLLECRMEHDWTCKSTHARTVEMIDKCEYYLCDCGLSDLENEAYAWLEQQTSVTRRVS
jgi:hypothetical protein